MLAFLLLLIASLAVCAERRPPLHHRRTRNPKISIDRLLSCLISSSENYAKVKNILENDPTPISFSTLTILWSMSINAEKACFTNLFIERARRGDHLKAENLICLMAPHNYMFRAEHFILLHLAARQAMEGAALSMLEKSLGDMNGYERRLDVIQFLATLVPYGHHFARFVGDDDREYSIPLLMAAAKTGERPVFEAFLTCCNPLPFYPELHAIEKDDIRGWFNNAIMDRLYAKHRDFFLADNIKCDLHDIRFPILRCLLSLETTVQPESSEEQMEIENS